MKSQKLELHGIIPPLITPLRGRDELDRSGLQRLVQHVLDSRGANRTA